MTKCAYLIQTKIFPLNVFSLWLVASEIWNPWLWRKDKVLFITNNHTSLIKGLGTDWKGGTWVGRCHPCSLFHTDFHITPAFYYRTGLREGKECQEDPMLEMPKTLKSQLASVWQVSDGAGNLSGFKITHGIPAGVLWRSKYLGPHLAKQGLKCHCCWFEYSTWRVVW